MPSAPCKLRRLSGADLPAMRGLLALYAEAFEMPAEYLDKQPDDDWLGEPGGRAAGRLGDHY